MEDVKKLLEKVDQEKLKEALAADEPETLKKLLEEEGISLNDEQLDYIAGGALGPWCQTC